MQDSNYLFSSNTRCDALNKIHAELQIKRIRQLLNNSIYGIITPKYTTFSEDFASQLTPNYFKDNY